MNRTLPILTIAAFIVSACGGGGGGATPPQSPSNPNPNPAGFLVVSAGNAKPAVTVAYGATSQSLQPGTLVSTSSISTSSDDTAQKPPVPVRLSLAPQVGPFGPDTTDCAVAGRTTVSGNIAGLLGFTTGDQINIESTDCDDGLGQVVNGLLEMTVASFSGDLFTGIYQLAMEVRLVDFVVVTATDTIRSNGDATATIDTTGSPLISTSVAGNSMTTVINSRTDTVSDFLTTQTVDISTSPAPYTLASSGSVDSSELSGSIGFTTPVTFQGSGTDYPFAGELLLTGANGGTIRLVALDNINVRIDTDTNGDGSIDVIEFTTWADIDI